MLIPIFIFAQVDSIEYTCELPEPKDRKPVYYLTNNMPSFPGGILKQDKFVDNHLHLFENIDLDIKYVDILLVVESDGSCSSHPCLRYKGKYIDNQELMDAAEYLVQRMPTMYPGRAGAGRDPEPVNALYSIRIYFK